jgi:hypothetical protein
MKFQLTFENRLSFDKRARGSSRSIAKRTQWNDWPGTQLKVYFGTLL